MEPIFDIVNSLQSAGLWIILVGIAVKFVTGTLAAIKENEFSWDYFGEILKGDLLKYVTALVLVYMYQQPQIAGPVIAVLSLDIATGVIRNVGRIFPEVADKLPNTILDTSTKEKEPFVVNK